MHRSFLLTLLALTASLSTNTLAQTITVDNPMGTFSSLKLAVASANAGATITIDDSVAVTLFECDIEILGSQDPLTIVPANNTYPPNVTIDGMGCSGSIFKFQAGVTNATLLHGLKIIHGSGTMVGGRLVGGGIACLDGASPLIRNCIINDNDAYDGGGVYIGQTENSLGPRLMRNIIRKNVAENSGGGVYLELVSGDIAGASQFSRSRISENEAAWAGGGMYAGGGTSPAIDLCWFFMNKYATNGSGICFEGTLDASISSTMVEENFTGTNGTSGVGGGLALLGTSSAYVVNSTFSLNKSGSGAGIYDQSINGFPAGPSEYVNDLIVANVATGFGGGMVAGTFDPSVKFCTIANNTAGVGNGGGIYSTGVNVDNSIVWGNSTPQFFTASGTATVNETDVQGGFAGTHNNNSPPFFANGATTPACANTSVDTYHLDQALSPCVDYIPVVVNPNFPAVIGRSTNPDRLIPDADTSFADQGFHYPGQGCH